MGRRRASALLVVGVAGGIGAFLVAPDAKATVSFSPMVEYEARVAPVTASGVAAVAMGDFDGDGDNDVVAGNVIGEQVTVLVNAGNGTFGAPTAIDSGGRAAAVVVANLNGDADPDIAVANQDDANVSIIFGDTGATFAAPVHVGVGTGPEAIGAGDFDGDGDRDLIVANFSSDTLSVLVNNAGTFSVGGTIAVADGPEFLAVGNLDGGGDLDVVVTSPASLLTTADDKITVLLGGGGATFSTLMEISLPGYSWRGVTIADFDGNGLGDFAAADTDDEDIVVFVNDGGSPMTFAPPVAYDTPTNPYAVTTAKINGDTDPGLVVSTQSSGVSVFEGASAATFASAATLSPGGGEGVAAGNLNAGTDEDIVTGRSTKIGVYLNNPNAAPTATVDLSSATPKTNDTLVATATRNDSNGDPVSLTYVWKVDGSVVRTMPKSTGTAADLTDSLALGAAGNGNKGQIITVEVTPNDGKVNGTMVSDTATVQNSAPTANVSLDDTTPKPTDTITASPTGNDADGDPVTFTYEWLRNGSTIAGESTSSLDLTGIGVVGDVITVLAAPNDGTTNGTAATAIATVSNTAPTATVSLAPANPTTNATMTATATKGDADGDPVTLTYVWKVNGVVKQTTSGGGLTDTFDLSVAEHGSKGDAISVEVTPNDGTTNGTPATDSETVANTAPTATVSLTPANPTTNATMTATATKGDVDSDPVSLTYVWKVGGVVKQTTPGGGLTDTFDLSVTGNGSKGQAVSVEVTPNDGTTNGTAATDSETIANSAPSAVGDSYDGDLDTSLTISGPGVLGNDSDADGDSLTAAKVANPSHGAVTVNSDGSFTYTPTAGYSGGDSFTYRASDGTATSSAITVSINVRLTCGGFTPTIVGTSGADKIRGTAGRDVIAALGGNDVILGAGGDDVICGGAGNDSINADAGNDIVYGGAGKDEIHGDAGNDALFGGDDVDSLQGDVGNDALDGGAGTPDSCQGGDGVDSATPACEKKQGIP